MKATTAKKSAMPTAAQLQELGDPIEGEVWRICVGCDEAFGTAEPRTRYCCPECRNYYDDLRRVAARQAAKKTR